MVLRTAKDNKGLGQRKLAGEAVYAAVWSAGHNIILSGTIRAGRGCIGTHVHAAGLCNEGSL